MDEVAILTIGLVFLLFMALIGFVYTVARIIDLVSDRNKRGEQ